MVFGASVARPTSPQLTKPLQSIRSGCLRSASDARVASVISQKEKVVSWSDIVVCRMLAKPITPANRLGSITLKATSHPQIACLSRLCTCNFLWRLSPTGQDRSVTEAASVMQSLCSNKVGITQEAAGHHVQKHFSALTLQPVIACRKTLLATGSSSNSHGGATSTTWPMTLQAVILR